jgi:hypothetical protein
MAFNIESISNAKRIRAPRIVLLGTSGIGKSEFAAGADSPIFLPVKGEEGIDALDVKSFPVIETYEHALEAVGSLYAGEHEFKTLVMDSASTFAPLVDEAAVAQENAKNKASLGGGFGHQFDTIVNKWRDLLAGFDALRNDKNMTIVIIGHVRIKPSREPDSESYDQWAFDIDRQVGDALIRWSDCTLFMNRKTLVKTGDGDFGKKSKRGIEITGGQRYLFTQSSPTHPGKARGFFGDLPAEIALPRKDAWSAFMAAVGTAVEGK